MQPDGQEPQTNPVQPDTTQPQVFQAPQVQQSVAPAATPFVSAAPPEQAQPTVYDSTPAAVSPEPFVAPKKKQVPTWLKIVIVVIAVAVIGGVVAFLAQNKKDTITQNAARANFAASSNVQFLQQSLESFYATSVYYPSDISSSTFDSLGIQAFSSSLTAPAGAKYVYTATPSGCTTAAKNCKAYTLSAVDTGTGANIITVNSTAGQTPTFKP